MKKKKCRIENCSSNVKAKNLCIRHYEVESRKLALPCKQKDCKNKSVRRGLCQKHYSQLSKQKCTLDNCDLPRHAKLYCKLHYLRHHRHGDPNIVIISEDGSGTINHNGYRVLYKPDHTNATINGTILEHRYIMSNFLGRPLKDNENVHHKNGDRTDNTIENLELWVKSQPVGQRPEDLIKWAKEILRIYETKEIT